MECVGAIDQGTQSTRVCLYDKQGQLVAGHQVRVVQICTEPGWTEHDPLELLANVRTCIQEAVRAATEKVGPVKVRGVGLTNQRETTIAWDAETGTPLYNAIVWLDNRTSAICQRMEQELGSKDFFKGTTGLPISTYFTAYKFAWLRDNVKAVQQALAAGTCRLGTCDTWLMHHLTGGPKGEGIFLTDVTNAACTNLMELKTRTWHEPTLKLFGIERSMLAKIRSSAEEYGKISDGPLAGVPITGCLGDQQAALLGQRCGIHAAKNTYGTGCFLLLNTGEKIVHSWGGLLTTIAWQLGPHAPVIHALEGSVAIAGSGISWLRDGIGLIESSADSESVAASVPNTAGVYFVPAFSGLLAPHWRDDARGALLGISSMTTRAHIVRAMLEAICWQTREVLDAMRSDADLSQLKLLRVDGGASYNALLMQLQADILQVGVQRPPDLEITCRGAAYAAGIGCGLWTEEWVMSDTHNALGSVTKFMPSVSSAEADKRYACWKIAVQRSLGLDALTH